MKAQSIRSVYFIVILLSVFVVVFSSVVFLKTAKEDHNTLDNLITFSIDAGGLLMDMPCCGIS